jgi:spore coat polysaccharide biosynthesis predicted glycosyltransferase SpsG
MADDPVACDLPARRGHTVQRIAGAEDRSWLDAIEPRDVVVFDGYPFLTSGIVGAAMERGATSVVLDDHDGGDVGAHWVINPSDVVPGAYRRARVARCGPQYAPVRREFMRFRRFRRPPPDQPPSTLLVTLGGSDATGATAAVLDALDRRGAFDHVLLVVGPAAPEPPSRTWLEVVRDPSDVPAVFDRADAAITAAGSTTWELLCLGIPTAIVPVAENQRLIARTVAAREAALVIDGVERIDDAIARMSVRCVRAKLNAFGLETVDGLGPWRVLEEVLRG